MREWIPVPGGVKARLLQAAAEQFERLGYDAASVIDIAADAGVTTGSLYHHFESKLGLFALLRGDLEHRIRDRLEGAFEGAGGGRAGIETALLVAFDAAVRMKAARILSEGSAALSEDVLLACLERLALRAPAGAAAVLLGAWRAALAAVGSAVAEEDAREALAWALGASRSPRRGRRG